MNDGERTELLVTDDMRRELEALRLKYKNKRRYIAEMKANVSAHMEGTIENWPSNIQDQIYAALERTSLGRAYTIRMSYCDHTPEDGWYVHVIATAEVTQQ